ncbi:nucleotide-binding protein [Actinomyces sp. 2119]|uniref:Nucleotide-binding protein n=1 Tax=Actinomyces lilanjuaniae TaxID=2321394 RepID=A0ABN5PND3_9ACTO|nr:MULTISPECIES: OB-fold nucleic acid binding domain-containing protein [Actinomyces]AYD89878.1 nucleotide-binding protein [Actinomyces lilanjuaniae]RJF44868.1 nucleotide-binding protein [Actinomyces sp. 2119]
MGVFSAVLRAVRGAWRHGGARQPEEGASGETALYPGTQAVAEVLVRRRARVCGVLQAVTYSPAVGRPLLIGHLFDGTGRLDLVWLGQRRVVGIDPGQWLVAEGTVADGSPRPRIYNPAYELLGTPPEPYRDCYRGCRAVPGP